jgi:hypothetical protein
MIGVDLFANVNKINIKVADSTDDTIQRAHNFGLTSTDNQVARVKTDAKFMLFECEGIYLIKCVLLERGEAASVSLELLGCLSGGGSSK